MHQKVQGEDTSSPIEKASELLKKLTALVDFYILNQSNKAVLEDLQQTLLQIKAFVTSQVVAKDKLCVFTVVRWAAFDFVYPCEPNQALKLFCSYNKLRFADLELAEKYSGLNVFFFTAPRGLMFEKNANDSQFFPNRVVLRDCITENDLKS